MHAHPVDTAASVVLGVPRLWPIDMDEAEAVQHLITLVAYRIHKQAMQLSFFFVLPNILLSGFMFPRQAMPQLFQWVGLLLPLTHFLKVLRGILLKGVGLETLWPQAAALTAWGVAILSLAILRSTKRAA